MSEYYFINAIFNANTITVTIKKVNDKNFEQTIKMTPMDFIIKQKPPNKSIHVDQNRG